MIVHQELQTMGREEAISILVIAADAVIDAFDADSSLGGVADFTEAIPAEF